MNNVTLTLLSRDRLAETYASGDWRDDTIYSLVRGRAMRSPEKTAVRDGRGALTYFELLGQAEALAKDMAEAGLRAGARVAVWASSRVETAVALLACSRNGYVCCPSLHRDHTVEDVLGLLRRMRASAFMGETGYGADGARRDIFEAIGSIETIRREYRLDPLSRSLAGFGADRASSAGTIKEDPNLVVYLAFTSGTTGAAKGVMHSENTLLANARSLSHDWRIDADSVIYTMSPLSHNLGLGSLVMALAVGGELVVHDLPRGASLLGRLIETGATFLVGVPTHAIDLLSEMKARGVEAVGSVRGFRISGAAAPRETVAELMRLGVTPQSGYGMTEAGSHHYTSLDDGADRILGSVGRACAGYEVKIWSAEDRDVELPVGEIGEIGGRGASLMLGYYDDQRANEDAFNASGWFMTGDLGRLDREGYLQVTGRKKDIIVRGGRNIYPAHLENLALQHEAIARAAALPVPDPRLGEKVCLAVTLKPGMEIDPADLLRRLAALGLSRYDMPEYWLKLEEIPLTASGKILKLALAAHIREGRLRPDPIHLRPDSQQTEA